MSNYIYYTTICSKNNLEQGLTDPGGVFRVKSFQNWLALLSHISK